MKPAQTLFLLCVPALVGFTLLGIGLSLFHGADNQANAAAANAMIRQSTIFFTGSSVFCLMTALGCSFWLISRGTPTSDSAVCD